MARQTLHTLHSGSSAASGTADGARDGVNGEEVRQDRLGHSAEDVVRADARAEVDE